MAVEDAEAEESVVAEPVEELSGSCQAAILLMALGEEEAASILQHMKPAEVQAIGEAMTAIDGVTQSQISGTLDQFIDRVGKESSLGLGSADYFKSTLTKALGKDKATSVLSRMEPADEESGLTALKWMDSRVVARIIRDEHPQIIATVLSQLSSDQAGDVLDRLPDDLHTDIILRISRLDKIHPSALADLDEIIQQLFENNAQVEISNIGGVKVASEILNGVSKESEERILELLEEADSELCEQIKEGMFIFENLLSLDDRGMQTLLREVSNDELILALKGASSEMQEKIFRNMSSRAAELLRDDLSAKGPVKLTEVETAQKEILVTAQKLAEDGKIALGGKGDDFV
ncbi:MAG: flagellar motor switch protein FliG [Granulosicoccus sp.]